MEEARWEYKITSDRGKMHRVDMTELNALGKEGWELVYVMKDPSREDVTNFYFKRAVKDGPQQ
jgi:hypothetical protein